MPEELLRAVEGKVWEWVIPSEDLVDVKGRCLVSGAVRRGDGVHVRLVAQAPLNADVRLLSPTPEDAYLYRLSLHREEARR